MRTSDYTERLALVYPKAIGDFFFVLPALHTLRRALAGRHITLVIKEKQAPLAIPQKGRLADEVLSIGGTTGWRDVRRKLTELKTDTVVDMAGNDKAGLLLAFRKGKRIRPHRSDCRGMCAVYSPFAETLPKLEPGMHRVDELLRFAAYLGATDPVISFRIDLPDRAIEESEKMITRWDLRSGSLIVLNLGASRDSKRWPAAHFLTLTRELLASGHRVALTGAHEFKADGHYDRKTVGLFHESGLVDGDKCIDLIAGNTLSPELHLQRDAHFLRYSSVPRLVVGNDTGPMHIAGSVGDDARNKTLSLFGPTHWGRYAPYDPSRIYPDKPVGDWNRVLASETDCSPSPAHEACRSYRSGCSHKQCMTSLAPRMVFEAITEMVEPQ